MRWPFLLALCAGLAGAACGDAATPTAPSAVIEAAPRVVVFSGTLAPRGSRFYSYTVTRAGTVTAMLASLVPGAAPTPVNNRLQLAIGIPAGTGCAARLADNVPPALVPQLTETASAGTHCVSVTDVDGLPAPMTFAVRITYP